MDEIPIPMKALSRLLQLKNGLFPKEVTVSGIVIDRRPWQF